MSQIEEKTPKMQRIVCKKRRNPIKDMAATALLAALMCVCSMIYIPLAVPITLQTFALSFGLFFLGGRLTTIACAIYVSIGALGVPVFAGFSGGLSRLLDASGGFIFGIVISALIYWVLEIIFKTAEFKKILFAIAAHLVLYLSGVLWYALIYLGGESGALISAFVTAVLPFIIPDGIKLVISYIIAKRLPKLG